MAPSTTKPATPRTRKPKRSVYNPDTPRKAVNARYDVAQSTEENEALWSGADGLSAASANSPSVRKVVRDRARYEIANNSYAAGIVDTLAADTVGPVVQLHLGDTDTAQTAEAEFGLWAKAVNLWAKVRTMRQSKAGDGEVFGRMFTNPRINNDIKLDVLPLECDMIEGWYSNCNRTDEIDGIRFDEYGNPTDYRLLNQHPGDHRCFKGGSPMGGTWIERKYMLHYFTRKRPGQVRGVSEIMPALSLFGQMRRYTSAVVETATRAAEISMLLYTKLVPDGVACALADPVSIIQAERNAILSLPEGWEAMQMKAEQPTDTYPDFKAEIINEMARCISMPFNVAAGNSSGYNYASGRLDHQTYDRNIEVERDGLEFDVLDRILTEWKAEYIARRSLTPEQVAEISVHDWYYAGRGHVDPKKEADADDIRLRNGTLNYATYYGRQGKDAKREQAQIIRELVQREVAWNTAREKAKLPPAPYPSQDPVETQTVEVENAED